MGNSGQPLKSINYIQNTVFKSNSAITPEWRKAARMFKADMKKLFKDAKSFEFHRGHFYCYFFVKFQNDKILYFRMGDVRWFKGSGYIREATSFTDYTGGSNLTVDFLSDDIEDYFLYFRQKHM